MTAPIDPRATTLFDLHDLASLGIEAWLAGRLRQCAEWFGASGASLFLSVPEVPGTFRLAARAGSHATAPDDAVLRTGEGLAGTVLELGSPMVVDDPERHAVFADRGVKRRDDLGCAMLLPLVDPQGERHGVISLSRRREEPHFQNDDLALAASLAAVVGLAVANARLLHRVEETARLKRLAELGQMAASVAHEIRNPLTGIRAAAQLATDDPAVAPDCLAIVNKEADRIDRLCEDFLVLARPLRLRREPATLAQAVEGAVFAAQADFRAQGITLEWAPEPNAPTLAIDIDRVRQAADNLVRNALQAAGSGGTVRVSVQGSTMTIEDDGAGMEPATLDRLFSPFFTTKPGGTGLGLCNVRRIVDAHGGTVRVESAPGRGTRFEIQFPRNAA